MKIDSPVRVDVREDQQGPAMRRNGMQIAIIPYATITWMLTPYARMNVPGDREQGLAWARLQLKAALALVEEQMSTEALETEVAKELKWKAPLRFWTDTIRHVHETHQTHPGYQGERLGYVLELVRKLLADKLNIPVEKLHDKR